MSLYGMMMMQWPTRIFGSAFPSSLTVTLFLLFVTSHDSDAVKIKNFSTPSPMKNGTIPSVILDCDFSYEDSEVKDLTVKWYKDNYHHQVYQWIPKYKPQVLGLLSGRVDLDYRASEDNYTMYRALRIMGPTSELSGSYRCQVSSSKNEDEKQGFFIVYSPATMVYANYTKPHSEAVNVTCKAEGMYPKPEVNIFVYLNREGNPNVHKIDKVDVEQSDETGGYDVFAHHVFEHKTLTKEVDFECVFTIPNADYNARQRLIYNAVSSNRNAGERTVHHGFIQNFIHLLLLLFPPISLYFLMW